MNIHSSKIPAFVAALPAFPKVITELLDCLRDQSHSLETMVRIARSDPVIAAEILSAANSLRRLRGMTDIPNLFAAASVVGLDRIRRIILTVGLNRFVSYGRGQSYFFEHSLAVAIVAQELAAMVRISPTEAYVAGILHDVGQLVFHVTGGDAYQNIRRQAIADDSLLDLESAMFTLNHCEVGLLLAKHWQLSSDVMLAIATHHERHMEWKSPLQAVISVAEVLVKALDLPFSPHNRVSSIPGNALEYLQLSWESPRMRECMGRCRARFEHARGNVQ